MTGDRPLENAAWENFAVARAKGTTLADAWNERGEAFPKLANPQARSSGSRCESRGLVAERIAYLREQIGATRRQEQSEAPEPFVVMEKVSDVLRDTYDAASRIGAPEGKLSRIRACWSSHVARLAKMKPMNAGEGTVDDLALLQVEACTCPS